MEYFILLMFVIATVICIYMAFTPSSTDKDYEELIKKMRKNSQWHESHTWKYDKNPRIIKWNDLTEDEKSNLMTKICETLSKK